jgi:hypothetical protein
VKARRKPARRRGARKKVAQPTPDRTQIRQLVGMANGLVLELNRIEQQAGNGAAEKPRKKTEPTRVPLEYLVRQWRDAYEKLGQPIEILDLPGAPIELRSFPHIPEEHTEEAALRESYRGADRPAQWRLRDLIVMAAGPSETHDFEPMLDDPNEYPDTTIATEALDGLADDLEALCLALHSAEGMADRHVERMLARLYKRARAAAELSRRVHAAGPPAFVKIEDKCTAGVKASTETVPS